MTITSTISKKSLEKILKENFEKFGTDRTCFLLDNLKSLGFYYATSSGLSLSMEDLRIPDSKGELSKKIEENLDLISEKWDQGYISELERFKKIIDSWENAATVLQDKIKEFYDLYDPLNNLYMMSSSGARGNITQVKQLIGMRGLMSDQEGNIINLPIKANFREGLTLIDYLISAYGARKGVVDTSLKTAEAGYLTRRLVFVAQDLIIKELDCQATQGIGVVFWPKKEEDEKRNKDFAVFSSQKESLSIKKLLGRSFLNYKPLVPFPNSFSHSMFLEKIFGSSNPQSMILTEDRIEKLKIFLPEACILIIRSPLTCQSLDSICQACYGLDFGKKQLVELGAPVGTIAAQSIGEPGTQLTMRTFHTGGVVASRSIENIQADFAGKLSVPSVAKTVITRNEYGVKVHILKESIHCSLKPRSGGNPYYFSLNPGTMLYVTSSRFLHPKEVIGEYPKEKKVPTKIKSVLVPIDAKIYFHSQVSDFQKDSQIESIKKKLKKFQKKEDKAFPRTQKRLRKIKESLYLQIKNELKTKIEFILSSPKFKINQLLSCLENFSFFSSYITKREEAIKNPEILLRQELNRYIKDHRKQDREFLLEQSKNRLLNKTKKKKLKDVEIEKTLELQQRFIKTNLLKKFYTQRIEEKLKLFDQEEQKKRHLPYEYFTPEELLEQGLKEPESESKLKWEISQKIYPLWDYDILTKDKVFSLASQKMLDLPQDINDLYLYEKKAIGKIAIKAPFNGRFRELSSKLMKDSFCLEKFSKKSKNFLFDSLFQIYEKQRVENEFFYYQGINPLKKDLITLNQDMFEKREMTLTPIIVSLRKDFEHVTKDSILAYVFLFRKISEPIYFFQKENTKIKSKVSTSNKFEILTPSSKKKAGLLYDGQRGLYNEPLEQTQRSTKTYPNMLDVRLSNFPNLRQKISLICQSDTWILASNDEKNFVAQQMFVNYPEKLSEKNYIGLSGKFLEQAGFKMLFQRITRMLFIAGSLVKCQDQEYLPKNFPLGKVFTSTEQTSDIIQGLPKIEKYIEASGIPQKSGIYQPGIYLHPGVIIKKIAFSKILTKNFLTNSNSLKIFENKILLENPKNLYVEKMSSVHWQTHKLNAIFENSISDMNLYSESDNDVYSEHGRENINIFVENDLFIKKKISSDIELTEDQKKRIRKRTRKLIEKIWIKVSSNKKKKQSFRQAYQNLRKMEVFENKIKESVQQGKVNEILALIELKKENVLSTQKEMTSAAKKTANALKQLTKVKSFPTVTISKRKNAAKTAIEKANIKLQEKIFQEKEALEAYKKARKEFDEIKDQDIPLTRSSFRKLVLKKGYTYKISIVPKNVVFKTNTFLTEEITSMLKSYSEEESSIYSSIWGEKLLSLSSYFCIEIDRKLYFGSKELNYYFQIEAKPSNFDHHLSAFPEVDFVREPDSIVYRKENGEFVHPGDIYKRGLTNSKYVAKNFFRSCLRKDTSYRIFSRALVCFQLLWVFGISSIYESQGVNIISKHFELIIKQMTNKVRIISGGCSSVGAFEILPKFALFSVARFCEEQNKRTLLLSSTVNSLESKSEKLKYIKKVLFLEKELFPTKFDLVDQLLSKQLAENEKLKIADNFSVIEAYNLKLNLKTNESAILENIEKRRLLEFPEFQPIVSSSSQSGLEKKGFLSSAGFREPKTILMKAAIAGKIEWFNGLKESVSAGKLIPAGTGFITKIERKKNEKIRIDKSSMDYLTNSHLNYIYNYLKKN